MNQPEETPQEVADKLTIEELAPYLPYGLRIMMPCGKIMPPMHGIEGRLVTHVEENNSITYTSLIACRPLLIPLPDLIPELAEWMANEKLAHVIGNRITFMNAEIAKEYLTGWFANPEMSLYFICQKIFKLHGDLFNLIGRRLAVNKLNYK